VAEDASEQLKQLLDAVVDRILVESRTCIQPYFVVPMVRTRPGPRRRTGMNQSEQGGCSPQHPGSNGLPGARGE
jgi:hypothetical protein